MAALGDIFTVQIQLKEKEPNSAFYMIKNKIVDDKRSASIAFLDPFLHSYQSEYEYVYSQLKAYIDMDDAPLNQFYNVPNLGRKLLETFFSFKYPGKAEVFDKMKKVDGYDEKKLDKIYAFVNYHSHAGTERAVGVDETLLEETSIIVKDIFELIEKADSVHYNHMEKILSKELRAT